ncbi:hypothetical protein BACI9J_730001 [Bacillus altitudinis]|nr:hypothetical protein BACI9J_730001 [Bacillus altitudinis]
MGQDHQTDGGHGRRAPDEDLATLDPVGHPAGDRGADEQGDRVQEHAERDDPDRLALREPDAVLHVQESVRREHERAEGDEEAAPPGEPEVAVLDRVRPERADQVDPAEGLDRSRRQVVTGDERVDEDRDDRQDTRCDEQDRQVADQVHGQVEPGEDRDVLRQRDDARGPTTLQLRHVVGEAREQGGEGGVRG